MTVSDRPAVKRRIVELLTDELDDGVQVSYGYPGQATQNEAVWLGEVNGSMETVDFGSPRSGRDDNYSLSIVVAVSGMASESDADERCQEILTDVCEALFTAPRLGSDFLATSIHPGNLDGPNGFRVAPSEPAASVAELTLTIRTAIRGALS